MITQITDCFIYAGVLLVDGLRRYIPRVSTIWWGIILIVFSAVGTRCWKRMMKGEMGCKTFVWKMIVTGYFVSALVITFGTRLPDPHIQYQLIPFLSHRLALQGDANEQFQLLCNVLLFVPFGVLYPFTIIGKREDTIFGVLCAAFSFSFSIEFLQLITRYGCFEIDDMINNVLGAVIGYLLVSLFRRIYRLCLKMFAGKKMEN